VGEGMIEYIFIDRALFFPEEGILTIGDLHLGYDYMIQQSGVLIPERQIKSIIEDLKKIFEQIEKNNQKVKKFVFLGDIKHSFSYSWREKNYFNQILEFLKTKVEDKNIILIKGNHDTIDYSFGDRLEDYHIHNEVSFIHGHKFLRDAFDKNIKVAVMGHIHPAVILSEKEGVKKENYKCFLTGNFKGKKIIISPSFLNSIEGAPVNDYEYEYEDYFSIIPKKDLMNFEVHVIGEDKVYSFGKVKDLDK
jgi:hypothetical protein